MATASAVPRGWLSQLRDGVRAAEDWYFDTRWNVDTAGERSARRATDIVGLPRDGHVYAPARARNVEAALDQLPADAVSSSTFVDLGSGKGRVVFLAARRPFRSACGVEYSESLHRQAEQNLCSFRGSEEARRRVTFLLADAAEFAFPSGDLVLHLFNPFGPEVMRCVLENLQNALVQEKRKVFIILLWPEQAPMVRSWPGVNVHHQDRRFEIFVAG